MGLNQIISDRVILLKSLSFITERIVRYRGLATLDVGLEMEVFEQPA